jgi:2-methylaconitate cis-trans-isomerase PrpF
MFLSAAAVIRAVQYKKQSSPMETAGDRMSFVRAEHPQKAHLSIAITESGMVMVVREEHVKKAPSLIVVTPSGMVMDVREEHP